MLLSLPIRDVAVATPRARIVRFDLGGQTFDYAAGQAVLVGVAGAERKRPYSIASAPEDARDLHTLELLVGVDAEGRAGPHLPLEAGTLVDVEGPLGSFTFPSSTDAHRFLFVAGGTGISPLRAMLRHAVHGGHAGRIGLLYSVRTPDEFAFEAEFRGLANHGVIEYRQTITRDTDREWTGRRGRIDHETLDALVHGADTLCFVCGPASMVDAVPKMLMEVGVPKERVRIEEW